MDNQPSADPQSEQNSQPTRRLFVYDRPHAAQREPDQPIPATLPEEPASDPTPQPDTVPTPHQPPAPEDVALSRPTAPPVKPQLPEYNFEQPDLVDLKPVWQVNLPEEFIADESPINQPYEQPKQKLWQRAQADPAPQPSLPPQPTSPPPSVQPLPAPPTVSPPQPTPPVAPALQPMPPAPVPPQPVPQAVPPISQQPRPEDIALSLPDDQPLQARFSEQTVFNNQFAPQTKPKRRFGLPKLRRVPNAMKLLAAMVLVAGAVVSFNTVQSKKQTNNQVADNPYRASQTGVLGSSDQPSTSNQPAAPSEDPLGDNFSLYRVEPGAPSKIIIPAISTDTRVFSVGVDNNNIIQSPDNINKIGWYEGSAQPGNAGVVVLNGYVEGPTKRGALYGIETLKQGDKITIERGDGVDLTYTIQAVESYENDQIDMSKINTPYILGKKGLNIMTVGGRYNATTGQYELRYAVFATEDGS